MFMCFLEYFYGICYYVIHKLPEKYMQGFMLVLRDKVFSDKIMFFTGLLAFIGVVFGVLGILFSKQRRSNLISTLLHGVYFYIYMKYFMNMPVTKIFSFFSKVVDSIGLLFK